jgi:hypothetical protein
VLAGWAGRGLGSVGGLPSLTKLRKPMWTRLAKSLTACYGELEQPQKSAITRATPLSGDPPSAAWRLIVLPERSTKIF